MTVAKFCDKGAWRIGRELMCCTRWNFRACKKKKYPVNSL